MKMHSCCVKFKFHESRFCVKKRERKNALNFLGKAESVSVIGGGEVVDNSTSLKSKTNKIDQDEQIRFIIMNKKDQKQNI